MATISLRKANTRLPPEVNRVLYVRNLPFNISSEEMYDIFGKYGAIRQIRIGTNKDTRGTAFVVYEDIYDAKTAVDHLSGFNVANRYLIVLYYQQAKMAKKSDSKKKEEEITRLQENRSLSKKNFSVPYKSGHEVTIKDFSAVINRLCKRHFVHEAKGFFYKMLSLGIHPNQELFDVIYNAFLVTKDYKSLIALCAFLFKRGLELQS